MKNTLSQKYLYQNLVKHIGQKEPRVLATIIESHGSAPQKSGSSALFNKKNLLEGTIGGGLVEHAVQEKAKDAVETKKSEYINYDLNHEIKDKNAAICGGGMCILLDATPEKHLPVFKDLATSLQTRIPGVLVTMTGNNDKNELVIDRFWITQNKLENIGEQFTGEFKQKLQHLLKNASSGIFSEFLPVPSFQYKDKKVHLEWIVPPPRLIIAGAGHVGKALSHMGKLLDFEVTVWDDREQYANTKNLPDADHVLSGELNTTLGKLVPQADTFIVIVTRGHKEDAEVLKTFIHSKAAYIGMIGSHKKVARIKQQFLAEGWSTPEKWDSIYAPIGLDISSRTVQEIALSIAAQLVQVKQNRNNSNG